MPIPVFYGIDDDNANYTVYDNGDEYTGLPVPEEITPTGEKEISITQNGTTTEDVYEYASAKITVNVPGGSTPTGTKEISITANGTTTEDVTDYASAEITANVPNTYTAGDEGKVVSSGALVSQGSDTVTQNGTVDTTLINSLLVNVQTTIHKLTHVEVTPTFNATQSNKITVQLPISNSFSIIVLADELPAVDLELYWALFFVKSYYNGGDYAKNYSTILRPNGTLGTDAGMITYNESTGLLSLGGPYGTFKAGLKYHVYFIDATLS